MARLAKRDVGRRLRWLMRYLEQRAEDARAHGRPLSEQAYDDAVQALLQAMEDLGVDDSLEED